MAKKQKPIKSALLQALEFLLIVPQVDDASLYANIQDGHAVRFNRIVAAGTEIDFQVNAAPSTALLALAIEQCGASYKIVQLSDKKLAVRSNDFQAFIPCAIPESLPEAIPDAPLTAVDDRLITALVKVAALTDAKAKTVLESCICLNPGTCIASDNRVILEAWHGLDLPPGLLLPKMAVGAIKKAKKHLANFGYSANTATFYFSDGTWIRSNLYQEKYPDVVRYLNVPTEAREVPKDLFNAAAKVAPFSTTGEVFIKDGLISSEPDFGKHYVGGELKLPIAGDHSPRIYFSEDLRLVAPHVLLWDENVSKDVTYFFGEKLRGAIFSRDYSQEGTAPSVDEDIPF